MRLVRTCGYTALALVGAAALAAPAVTFPADTGTWAPLALAGTPVPMLVGTDMGVLVAHGDRIELVHPDGAVSGFKLPRAVQSLAADKSLVYAGTTDGAFLVFLDGRPPQPAGLRRLVVLSVDVTDGVVHAGTEDGLHRLDAGGSWSRIWPARRKPGRAASDVLAVPGAVLFVHNDALYRLTGEGPPHRIGAPRGADVVSLSHGSRPGQVWMGLRGAPLLLESEDGGLSWTPRGDGLGLSTVQDVAVDPADPRRVLVGGTGLADGQGNAGVQVSTDSGRTWHVEQDRLSNTHVFAVAIRKESLALDIDLPAVASRYRLPLPVEQSRDYAATNGSGVYSARPSIAVAEALNAPHRMLRLADPLLLGLVALLSLVPAYVRLTHSGDRDRGTHPAPPLNRTTRIRRNR